MTQPERLEDLILQQVLVIQFFDKSPVFHRGTVQPFDASSHGG